MISVCMATYNGAEYLKEQIDSILIQLAPTDELVISDDFSSDNTIKIIKSYNDRRIKLIQNKTSKSITSNFENAILNSKGDYIFLSDQDDIWLENKIDKTMQYLIKYDLVISDAIITDKNLNVLFFSSFDIFKSKKGILKNIIKNSYYGSCMAFKRKIIEKAIPIPKNKEIGHDLWLGLVAELFYKVYFIKEPLIFYRRHELAVTFTSKFMSERKLYKKIIGRIIIIYELTKFFLRSSTKYEK